MLTVVKLCLILLCWSVGLTQLTAQQQALPSRTPLNFDLPIKSETDRVTATNADWPTEVWQQHVKQALTEILKAPDPLPKWVSDSVQFHPLRPSPLTTRQLGPHSVHRPQSPPSALQDGRDTLTEQLRALSSSVVHVKVIGIQPTPDDTSFSAEVLVELDTPQAQQRLQWHTLWSTSLQLLEIKSTFFEETRHAAKQPLFVDRTSSIFANDPAFVQQLKFGVDAWRSRLESGLAPLLTGFYGLAMGDANGDGLEDLFVCQPQSLPNRLFLRQPDGTLANASQTAGVSLLDATSSALFIDVDNDGDQDLLVAGDGFFIYYSNDGAARFQKRQALPLPGTITSLTAADADNDGRLDVYVCSHTPLSQKDQDTPLGLPIPIHNANNGQANLMLRNTPDQGFVDATARVGLDVNNRRFSYAAAWEDFDRDGDVDLYVANDFGQNNLYRNDQGRFIDVAAAMNVEDIGSGMSVSWGDVNGDGWMDLYVGNMFSSAGNRIASHQRHRDLARGNSLFINQAGKRFERAPVEWRAHLGRWAWSSQIADINNDGLQDLLVANGFVTNRRLDDL